MNDMRRWCSGWLCALLAGLTACGAPTAESTVPVASTPAEEPTAPVEMRGVWVSYLELDGLLTGAAAEQAQVQLDALMDTCKAQGLNTVFFHTRAHGDAYYASRVYPAAASAAGLLAAGVDPLAYAVAAAHSRGLALHAWVNPYRIGADPSRAVAEVPRFQKDGVWYYDPAAETARALVLNGVRELLDGYAVDGVHFDDYFYPAGMSAAAEDFETVPEGIAVGDWRRTQVDALISGVYGLCRGHGKPFGVSPAARLDYCRETLCADVALWMRQPGYIDYVCPQIYSGFQHSSRPFPAVLEEWLALPRHKGLAFYGGLAFYKAGLAEDKYAGNGKGEWAESHDILARQLQLLRQRQADGFILFRYAQLTDTAPAVQAERERFLTELRGETP